MSKAVFRAPLLDRTPLGAGYHLLTFAPEAPLVAAPGQFAMVRSTLWGSAPLLPRPMSLVTAGARPSILIKVVGDGTRRMAGASPGEVFELTAPLGTAWQSPTKPGPVILVGGGVGIAPLIYLLEGLNLSAPITCIYGGRSAGDLPLAERFEGKTRLLITTEDGSRGQQGRVTTALKDLLAAESPSRIYTCGPNAMMRAVAEMAAGANVDCDVALEAPMACGFGVCLGCPIPRASGGFLYACTQGPCVDAREINWSHPL